MLSLSFLLLLVVPCFEKVTFQDTERYFPLRGSCIEFYRLNEPDFLPVLSFMGDHIITSWVLDSWLCLVSSCAPLTNRNVCDWCFRIPKMEHWAKVSFNGLQRLCSPGMKNVLSSIAVMSSSLQSLDGRIPSLIFLQTFSWEVLLLVLRYLDAVPLSAPCICEEIMWDFLIGVIF